MIQIKFKGGSFKNESSRVTINRKVWVTIKTMKKRAFFPYSLMSISIPSWVIIIRRSVLSRACALKFSSVPILDRPDIVAQRNCVKIFEMLLARDTII